MRYLVTIGDRIPFPPTQCVGGRGGSGEFFKSMHNIPTITPMFNIECGGDC